MKWGYISTIVLLLIINGVLVTRMWNGHLPPKYAAVDLMARVMSTFHPTQELVTVDDAEALDFSRRTMADEIHMFAAAPPGDAFTVAKISAPSRDGSHDIGVDMFFPTAPRVRNERTRLPLLIYFHGGGWVRGGYESHHQITARLAVEGGVIVASVDYRLAPEHRFPTGLHDCIDAVDHVLNTYANIQGNIDRQRVLLGGDSAGGNLAAVVAIEAARAEILPYPLIGNLIVYPVTAPVSMFESQVTEAYSPFLTTTVLLWFWSQTVSKTEDLWDPRLAPIFYSEEDLVLSPPSYVLVCEHDPLRDEGLAYADNLRKAGVEVVSDRLVCVHGEFGLGLIFNGVVMSDRVVAFMKDLIERSWAQ